MEEEKKKLHCLITNLNDKFGQFLMAPSWCFNTTSISFILTELQELLKNSNEEHNKEYADYVATCGEVLDAWYKFQSWQFNCKFDSSL